MGEKYAQLFRVRNLWFQPLYLSKESTSVWHATTTRIVPEAPRAGGVVGSENNGYISFVHMHEHAKLAPISFN